MPKQKENRKEKKKQAYACRLTPSPSYTRSQLHGLQKICTKMPNFPRPNDSRPARQTEKFPIYRT